MGFGFRAKGLGSLQAGHRIKLLPMEDMSHNLNSLKGLCTGLLLGTTTGDMKWDTRSLEYGSCSFGKPAENASTGGMSCTVDPTSEAETRTRAPNIGDEHFRAS